MGGLALALGLPIGSPLVKDSLGKQTKQQEAKRQAMLNCNEAWRQIESVCIRYGITARKEWESGASTAPEGHFPDRLLSTSLAPFPSFSPSLRHLVPAPITGWRFANRWFVGPLGHEACAKRLPAVVLAVADFTLGISFGFTPTILWAAPSVAFRARAGATTAPGSGHGWAVPAKPRSRRERSWRWGCEPRGAQRKPLSISKTSR